jgi:hypothetical protein
MLLDLGEVLIRSCNKTRSMGRSHAPCDRRWFLIGQSQEGWPASRAECSLESIGRGNASRIPRSGHGCRKSHLTTRPLGSSDRVRYSGPMSLIKRSSARLVLCALWTLAIVCEMILPFSHGSTMMVLCSSALSRSFVLPYQFDPLPPPSFGFKRPCIYPSIHPSSSHRRCR